MKMTNSRITPGARRRMAGILLAATLFCPAQPVPAREVCVAHLPGHAYRLHVWNTPRPVRLHVMTVDLDREEIAPKVRMAAESPEADRNAVRTDPRELADHPGLLSFINANPWSPWSPEYPIHVRITGLAATAGTLRSPPDGRRVSVWIDARGAAHIGTPEPGDVVEGIGGFQQIVKEGDVIVPPEGPIHPRTAIGVDPDGRRLWMIVVEGRNPGVSEGMTVGELARWMRETLGVWNAANLDGGGSSVMGIVDARGAIRILDGPEGRFLRPLPIVFTIRRVPAGRPD